MKKISSSISFLKAGAIAAGVLMMGCQPQASSTTPLYPKPVVAFGFVIYDNVRNDQMYFVPLRDSTKHSVSPEDFKSERLNNGFSFSASTKVRDALALMDTFSIANQLHDQRLRRYMGRTLFTPVRIVYEIDPDALGVFTQKTLVDTITLGRNRYERKGEKVTLVVNFPGADVLKVSRIQPD